MPLEVLEVTNRFMRDPVRILVKRDELTLEGIKQFYIGTSFFFLFVFVFLDHLWSNPEK